jgi:hypothetical protein
MALELIVADMVATVYRSTSNPIQSIQLKRQRFHWLFEDNKAVIIDSMLGKFYPEEIQMAVDELFALAETLVQRKDLG